MFFIPFIIRLQKAIKDEIENGTGPPASTDTDAGVKIKKDVEEIQTKKPVLSLEVQKKINTLMKRYVIVIFDSRIFQRYLFLLFSSFWEVSVESNHDPQAWYPGQAH